MNNEMLQQLTHNIYVTTLFMPVLIIIGTIALIWFLRPGFVLGAVLGIAGLVLALASSPVLWSTLATFGFFFVLSFFIESQAADVPGQPSSNSYEIHYRLDVNLMVDGRPFIGSVVQGLRKESGISVPVLGIGPATKFYGQALVLDLPGGRPSLIVPMAMAHLFKVNGPNVGEEYVPDKIGQRESYYSGLFFYACGFYTLPGREHRVGYALNDAEDNAQWFRWLNSFKGSCEVTPDLMPVFLGIDADYDLNSLQLADPNNLSAQFGSGVEFVSVSVSVVDDLVSTGIEEVFPELDEYVRLTRNEILESSSNELLPIFERMHVIDDKLNLIGLGRPSLYKRNYDEY